MHNKIKDYLKNNILLTDGAMGTYYATQYGRQLIPEEDNILNPKNIYNIHNQYIKAGAKLIRTNTFSANAEVLKTNTQKIKEIVKAGYRIAKDAVGDKNVFIAADIGPIPDVTDLFGNTSQDKDEEYKMIIKAFLEEGADIFLFETFDKTDYIEKGAEYIKSIRPDAFVIAQFAFDETGFTRAGISLETIFLKVRQNAKIDACGFNCIVGPLHMLSMIQNLPLRRDFILSALPNAGYPVIEDRQTVYPGNAEYYAGLLVKMVEEGAKIVGGCCGTTPEHIQIAAKKIYQKNYQIINQSYEKKPDKTVGTHVKNFFREKLESGKKVILVELDPPFSSDLSSLIKAAKFIKDYTDAITIADSPLGKVRVDSVIISGRIKRETNTTVIPHICCRDKNVVGLKASVLGAHTEDIRNILVITGDPLPGNDRATAKSVFNLNSKGLMEMINDLNKQTFYNSEVYIGGALNPNVPNFNAQLKKTEDKVKAGARFFLTQPVYTDEAVENLQRVKREIDAKIIAGIMPVANYNNAIFLNNEVPGITVPQEYVNMFAKCESKEESLYTGIKVALDCAKKVEGLDGYYFMPPFNRVEMIAEIIKELRKL